MPQTRTFYRSWFGGVVAPQMTGRIDSLQYQAGAEEIGNFGVLPQGVLRRRPGFQDCGAAKSGRVRLIDFDAGPDDVVTLELGQGYLRFWRDLARIVVSGLRNFTGASGTCSMAIGTTVTQAGHSHVDGDQVSFSGGTLPPQLSAGVYYWVVSANIGAGTYSVALTEGGAALSFTVASTPTVTAKRRFLLGDLIRSAGIDYYCRGGNDSVTPAGNPDLWYVLTALDASTSIYEIPAPWTTAQLRAINYDQVNDVVTMVHREFYPQELRRYSDTLWTLTGVQFEASRLAPAGITVHALPGDIQVPSAISNAAVAVVTFPTAHRIGPGDGVYFQGVTFTTATDQFRDGFYLCGTAPTPTTATFKRYDGTALSGTGLTLAVGGNGTMRVWPRSADSTAEYVLTTVAAQDGSESLQSAIASAFNFLDADGARNLIEWDDVEGASRFRIYKRRDGLFQYIGEIDGKQALPTATVSFTFSASGTTINWTGHPMVEGQPFRLTPQVGGSLPTGTSVGALSATTTYFVRLTATNSFYFSTQPDGPSITGGVAGIGTTTCTARRFFEDDGIGSGSLDGTGGVASTPPLRDIDELASPGNYPAAVGHYQQRRVFAGTDNEGQTFWASRAGTESDFAYHAPDLPDDKLDVDVTVRRRADIRHVVPLQDLLLMTASSEVRVRALGSVLTVDSIEILAQTHVGATEVRPQLNQNAVTFVGERDNHVTELQYAVAASSYVTNDLSLRANHLFDGFTILESAQMRSPFPVDLWLRSDGRLVCCTYVPAEKIAAWWELSTDGEIESICVAREGEQDRLYASVVRQVGAGTVRRIERLGLWTSDMDEAIYSDAAVVATPTGALVSGLTHLEGQTVQVLADGRKHPPRTVTAGQIVLQRADYTRVVVGRSYRSTLRTLPVVLTVEAYAQGRGFNVSEVVLRVVETAGDLMVGPVNGALRPVLPNQPTLTRTQDIPLQLAGRWDLGGKIAVQHEDPLPCQIAAMTLQLSIGD